MIDYILVGLLAVCTFNIGFGIAKGLDNNHRELFQGYIDETLKLNNEIEYWKNCFNMLYNSLEDFEVEDEVKDYRGNTIQVFFKNGDGK